MDNMPQRPTQRPPPATMAHFHGPATAGANAGLESGFEAVLSVDPLRVFKPSPRVYQLAVDRLGVAPAEIGFASSNSWDIAGATAFGFTTFWINRAGQHADELGQTPHAVLSGLDQLAGHL